MAKAILGKYIQPEVLNRLARHEFEPRQLVEGNLAGAHKSPFHGFAVEFAGHREYVPGDDLRHLDWNVYYRHDRFVIKQYEMETNFVCHMMLDISASMRYGEADQRKLTYASRMAATLGYLIIEQLDKVALATFDEQVREALAPSNALPQLIRMTEVLDRAEPVQKTAIGSTILQLAPRTGRRGIIIILSDFFVDLADLEQALQRLRYEQHEVVCFQVMHRDELDFRIPGMVRFEALEEDERFLTRPADIRNAYLEALSRFRQRLENVCEANRCELVLCDTSRPMAELFANYLQQRAVSGRRRWMR
jgi:uncharacterized protein (DUF58 family)